MSRIIYNGYVPSCERKFESYHLFGYQTSFFSNFPKCTNQSCEILLSDEFFRFQNNSKNLDPSDKMDLDFWK